MCPDSKMTVCSGKARDQFYGAWQRNKHEAFTVDIYLSLLLILFLCLFLGEITITGGGDGDGGG